MKYDLGSVLLDCDRRELWEGDVQLPVQPLVFDLLLYLVEHRDRVVSKDELLDTLWPDSRVTEGSLARAISLARRAIGDTDRSQPMIRNIPRRGYRFSGTVREHAEATDAHEPVVAGATPNDVPIPRTRYARSGDTHIAYQILGDGPVDVVVIHGWMLSMQSVWSEQRIAAFHRRLAGSARLILFDKRGTGLSDRVKALPGLGQRMEDLRAVQEAAGSERAFLVGVSEGAPMSILYAAAYPERTLGLCLLGGFARMRRGDGQAFGWGDEDVLRLDAYIRERWGQGGSLLAATASLRSDPAAREWASSAEQVGGSPGAALELWSMNQDIDVRDALPALGVPTLIMHSREDPVIEVAQGRELAKRIEGARYVELPGSDHLLFMGEQAESVGAEIEAWLHEPASGPRGRHVLATLLFADMAEATASTAPLEPVVRRHAGEPASCEVGGLVARFSGPAAAIRCAQALRARGAPAARFALHCSEVELVTGGEEGRVCGTGVDLAAEIFREARPGEILVSRSLRDLVAGSGIDLQPRGEVPLEGANEAWMLFAVAPPDVATEP